VLRVVIEFPLPKTTSRQREMAVPYAIRPAEAPDVPQLAEIEKEAFPTTWPSTPFKREVSNSRASYLVAWELPPGGHSTSSASGEPGHSANGSGLPGLRGVWRRLVSLFQREAPSSLPTNFIAGYVSTMFMTDEAHITGIAVRESRRGSGLGELLLLASIEMAMKRQSRVVTLEVRVSNQVAQSLYTKYGFKQVGLRKRYYADDHEDGYIMTTDPISSPAYRESFQRLLEAYKARWGEVALVLG